MLSDILVKFYRWWHGRLKLIGAGFLLTRMVRFVVGLHKFPLTVPEVGIIKVDFRDIAAFECPDIVILMVYYGTSVQTWR